MSPTRGRGEGGKRGSGVSELGRGSNSRISQKCDHKKHKALPPTSARGKRVGKRHERQQEKGRKVERKETKDPVRWPRRECWVSSKAPKKHAREEGVRANRKV